MVRGIEKFKERFGEYTGQYVFIGGTACDIILGREGVAFRATKDLDMVLVIEALDGDFVNAFVSFIEEGGYQHINKGTGENQFYRFQSPTDNLFPAMIELFSRKPDYLDTIDAKLSHIHVSDDMVSLSAILLDDEYYALLRQGAVEIEGVSALDLQYLILFKMKAFLDLSERKAKGEVIDSKNIKKHKNDILRLAANLSPDVRLQIGGQVRDDAVSFIGRLPEEKVDLKSLGIRGTELSDLVERMEECYGLNL